MADLKEVYGSYFNNDTFLETRTRSFDKTYKGVKFTDLVEVKRDRVPNDGSTLYKLPTCGTTFTYYRLSDKWVSSYVEQTGLFATVTTLATKAKSLTKYMHNVLTYATTQLTWVVKYVTALLTRLYSWRNNRLQDATPQTPQQVPEPSAYNNIGGDSFSLTATSHVSEYLPNAPGTTDIQQREPMQYVSKADRVAHNMKVMDVSFQSLCAERDSTYVKLMPTNKTEPTTEPKRVTFDDTVVSAWMNSTIEPCYKCSQ